VVQYGVVCCSALQCAVMMHVLSNFLVCAVVWFIVVQCLVCMVVKYSLLQCVAECCGVGHSGAVSCVYCSVMQFVAECCRCFETF